MQELHEAVSARDTPMANRLVFKTSLSIYPFCFDVDLEIMISLFLSAGLKGRPECCTLVSLNYLHCRLDCQVYSTKHSVLIFLFSNKNTQHSHKDEKVGKPFSLLVFVISFYMECIQK